MSSILSSAMRALAALALAAILALVLTATPAAQGREAVELATHFGASFGQAYNGIANVVDASLVHNRTLDQGQLAAGSIGSQELTGAQLNQSHLAAGVTFGSGSIASSQLASDFALTFDHYADGLIVLQSAYTSITTAGFVGLSLIGEDFVDGVLSPFYADDYLTSSLFDGTVSGGLQEGDRKFAADAAIASSKIVNGSGAPQGADPYLFVIEAIVGRHFENNANWFGGSPAKISVYNIGSDEISGISEAAIGDNAFAHGGALAGLVSVDKIAAGGLGAAVFADNLFGTAHLADAAVGSGHIANGAVGSGQIVDGAIASAHIATGGVPGSAFGGLSLASLADNILNASHFGTGLDGSRLQALSVGTAQLASATSGTGAVNGVNATSLAAGAVGAQALAGDLVNNAKFAEGTLTLVDLTSQLQSMLTVQGGGIAAGSINASHFASTARIDTAQLDDASFNGADLADNAVATSKFSANSVGQAVFARNSLLGCATYASDNLTCASGTGADANANDGLGSIGFGSVSQAHLVDANLTGRVVQAGAINASRLVDASFNDASFAANSIQTAQIADAAVTSSRLLAQVVAGRHFGAGAISSASVEDGSIGSAKLVAGAVNAVHLASSAITAAKLATDAVGTRAISNSSLAASAFDSATMTRFGAAAIAIGAASVNAKALPTGVLQERHFEVNAVSRSHLSSEVEAYLDRIEALATDGQAAERTVSQVQTTLNGQIDGASLGGPDKLLLMQMSNAFFDQGVPLQEFLRSRDLTLPSIAITQQLRQQIETSLTPQLWAQQEVGLRTARLEPAQGQALVAISHSAFQAASLRSQTNYLAQVIGLDPNDRANSAEQAALNTTALEARVNYWVQQAEIQQSGLDNLSSKIDSLGAMSSAMVSSTPEADGMLSLSFRLGGFKSQTSFSTGVGFSFSQFGIPILLMGSLGTSSSGVGVLLGVEGRVL